MRILLLDDPPPSTLLVYGDNRSIVEGWWNGRSRNRLVNRIFRRIHELIRPCRVSIVTRYVASADNPADGPSRGRFPSSVSLLPSPALPAELSERLVDMYPLDPSLEDIQHSSQPKPPRDSGRDRRGALELRLARDSEASHIGACLGRTASPPAVFGPSVGTTCPSRPTSPSPPAFGTAP